MASDLPCGHPHRHLRLTAAGLAALLLVAACSSGETAAMHGGLEPRCFPGRCETAIQASGRWTMDMDIYGGGRCAIASTVARNSDGSGPARFKVTMVEPDVAVWADVVAESGTFGAVQEFDRGFGWVEVEIDAVGPWKITANCDG